MNLRALRSFVVLAEELSFSRAAERLRVAQPALSQQIRGLERQLGAQLVDRGHRPLRLTEAGAYLVVEAGQILTACDEAAATTRDIGTAARGWLAVGFTRSSMYSVLPPALRSFHLAHPRVELELYEMVTEEQAQALRDGRIHIGIGRQPAPVADCRSRILLRERLMVVLAHDHPRAADDEVRIADLADTPIALYPKLPSAQFPRSVESLYLDEGLVPPVAHRVFEIQTAISLVAAGLGVTFVGESVARLGRADVVYRHIAGVDPSRTTTTLEATFRAADPSPHLQAFLGCLPDIGATGQEPDAP